MFCAIMLGTIHYYHVNHLSRRASPKALPLVTKFLQPVSLCLQYIVFPLHRISELGAASDPSVIVKINLPVNFCCLCSIHHALSIGWFRRYSFSRAWFRVCSVVRDRHFTTTQLAASIVCTLIAG